MINSRRIFFNCMGAVAAASSLAEAQRPVGLSRTALNGPLPFPPDDTPIRLNENENAYGPSRTVAGALYVAIASANRYPIVDSKSLTDKIAGIHRVRPQQILLGCGSTDILRMAAFAFLGRGKPLIQALPTYEAMERYARAVSSEVISVPLTPRFFHDLESMRARVTESTGLVYICNPNNPTASLTPRKDLETFIGKLPASTFVLMDEAYHHYAGQSGMYASFIDHPIDDVRVIVTRTFSAAYGLAGLRLGYAVASPHAVQKMGSFASQNNINTVVAQAASAALDDSDGLNELVRRNINDRQEFFNQAMARALKPIDSHANFVMMDTFHPSEEVTEHFRKNDVLIRGGFLPMSTYIRISLGRPEEMRRFWQVWDLLPYPKHSMQH